MTMASGYVILRTEMADKDKQPAPLPVRLWASNRAWFEGWSKMYASPNAAFNIALLKAQGKGDYEIEEECKKHLRRKK